MPFYPSYYPQEITVETLSPAAAAARLDKNTLHAYVGGDPLAGKPVPDRLSAFSSLGSYVVVTFNPAASALATREARCAAARKIVGGFTAADGVWTRHPYPVTPYHPDFLPHADLADAAVRAYPKAASPGPPAALRVRARGKLAERLVGVQGKGSDKTWEALVEEVDLRALAAGAASALHGGVAPPWIKQGWFHAWLVLADGLRDRETRDAAQEAFQRLTTAGAERPLERLGLERALVARLAGGCERVVAGYTLRREIANNDYSAGVENVAADSLGGLDSAIFLRTVKLKDFPWNGWLTVGVPSPPTAAWNPVAGFTDPTGRLVWAAIADPAMFPEPYAASWVENRVRLQSPPETVVPGRINVPRDALRPEAGTGLLKEVGDGRTAQARLTYRVLSSAYHDGTRMTPADALYALAFGYRWGAGQGPTQDAEVRRAAALAREWLLGVKVVRVETDVLRFGEISMKYEVPIIDAYLGHVLPDPYALAAVSPPWSTVPWHALALMEEAVRRGLAAFSAEEARRRGVPWLDVVRDARLRERLTALVAELEAAGFVPDALKTLVTPKEASARWAALREFAAERKHFLVTNGPYQVHTWSPGGAVLRVVRDFSYPLGVGAFNRYPIPLHGYIGRVEVRGDRLEVHAEAQRVERFAREYRIVTEPVGSPATQKDRGAIAVCRYVIVGPDGAVVKASTVSAGANGVFVLSRDGLPRAGPHTALLAVSVNGNDVNAHVKSVRLE